MVVVIVKLSSKCVTKALIAVPAYFKYVTKPPFHIFGTLLTDFSQCLLFHHFVKTIFLLS